MHPLVEGVILKSFTFSMLALDQPKDGGASHMMCGDKMAGKVCVKFLMIFHG